MQIDAFSSRSWAAASVHGVIFVKVIGNPAEEAAAGLGGCRIGAVRQIVVTKSARQIVWISAIGPREGWALCGAALLCKFISYSVVSRLGGEPAV